MELSIINQTSEVKWNRYRKDFLAITNKTLVVLNQSDAISLSVIFVDDEQIKEINHEYRNKDVATDVISFAMEDSEDMFELVGLEQQRMLGDIFINIEAVVRQSKDYQHTLRRETCFLFVHGLLHLLGYDHANLEEETVMFGLQNQILSDIAPKRYRAYEKI